MISTCFGTYIDFSSRKDLLNANYFFYSWGLDWGGWGGFMFILGFDGGWGGLLFYFIYILVSIFC